MGSLETRELCSEKGVLGVMKEMRLRELLIAAELLMVRRW